MDLIWLAMHDRATPKVAKISQSEFQQWQQQFVFDALRGQGYGRSFCDHFGIRDYRISFERNIDHCDRIIRRDYVETCTR